LGWAGCRTNNKEIGPELVGWFAKLKNKFEKRFEIEFEFDSHSNSNLTHLNSK
jgi:hypothetical protein